MHGCIVILIVQVMIHCICINGYMHSYRLSCNDILVHTTLLYFSFYHSYSYKLYHEANSTATIVLQPTEIVCFNSLPKMLTHFIVLHFCHI